VFRLTLPKAKVVGDRVMFAPVPVRGTTCGLPVALSLIVIVPAIAPEIVGMNLTVIVHCAPALRVLPQLFVSLKSPPGTMLVMLKAADPVLVSFTVFDELVVFTCWALKVRLVGDRVTVVPPAVVPLPVRLITCGLPAALSLTLIVPGWLPVAVGVKVTLMEQLAPAATEAPQVLVWAYCALATMLVMVRAAVPPLVRVTVCAALVVLTF